MPWFTQQKGMNMTTNSNPILNALITRNGRVEAGTFSIVQIATGVFMFTSKNFKLPALILLQTGFAGGYYAYRQTKESFQWGGYLSQTAESIIMGGIGSTFGSLFQGGNAFVKICTNVASGFFGGAAAETCHQLYEHGHLKDKNVVFNRACSGGIGGLASSVTSTGFDQFATEMSTATKVAFEAAKGSASSATSKMARNWHDGREVLSDVLEVALIGGGMSGVIATFQEWQLSKELSKIKEQKMQVEKALKSAEENKAKQEANLKRLEQMNEKQNEILAAKEEVAEATKQLAKTEAQSKQMLQSYEFAKKSVSKEVKSNLARGNRAIINHKNTQDAHLISEALLNGQKVIWVTNDPYRPYIHRSSNPFRLHYQRTERYVLEIQKEIAQLEQSIAQNQAVLTELMQCKPGETCISTYTPAQVETLQAETAKLQKQLDTETLKVKELDLLTQSQRFSKYASLDFQGTRIESLKDVIQASAITYVDCDGVELIKHVVLVHAVDQYSVKYHLGFEAIDLDNQDVILRFLSDRIFTADGIFGQHLELDKRGFGDFEHRPHTHWAWNQLVQPNSGAVFKEGWDGAKMAVLEPLAELENTPSNRPFAVAPYDTFVLKPFRLSKKSIILVPKHHVEYIRTKITDFQGQVVGYDSSKNLRTAILETLSTHYPETWHVCNPEGELLGGKAHYTIPGYETKTCLKTHDGKIIVLLHGEGKNRTDQSSQAMQDFRASKRFIGLHVNSTTYWLEDKPYFQLLKKVLTDQASIKKETLFAGHPKNKVDAQTVGVLFAFKFYRQLLGESIPQTGCYEVANYALKEAIFADIMSLFFQMNPEKDFTLTNLDLQMIVSPIFSSCKRLFLQMEHYANSDQKKAQEVYGEYCDLLKESLRLIEQAQEETKNSLPAHSKQTKVDFAQADAIWDAVTLPEEIACDLGKNWPLPSALQAYVSKVFQLLPKEAEGLNACYQQLCHEKSTTVGPKEQYRLNVLCSATAYATQEQIYLKILDQNIVSPLATLFATHEEWLKVRHLETADFTKKIGDCLFDNIIAQVPELSSKTAQELRAMLVKFMADHADEYQTKPDFSKDNFLEVGDGAEALYFTDWKSYLEVLGKPQVWATELEIQAVSVLLQRPIVLVSAGGVPKIYHEQSPNVPIFLNHKNWNHYESCRPLSPHTAQEIYQMIKQEPHY
jgi:hypothetical protein